SLPKSAVLGDEVGESMIRSIGDLQGIDAYLAHVGTLQHKIALATCAAGVVHGPPVQMERPESGHFSIEAGKVPRFLAPNSVRDVCGIRARGPGSADYEIVETACIVSRLRDIFLARARTKCGPAGTTIPH